MERNLPKNKGNVQFFFEKKKAFSMLIAPKKSVEQATDESQQCMLFLI